MKVLHVKVYGSYEKANEQYTKALAKILVRKLTPEQLDALEEKLKEDISDQVGR